MSVLAMAWAWRVPVKSASERVVLVALADHSDDQGRCWPGQEGLAEKCCMHRVSVNRIVKRLADAGLVEIRHRAKEDGSRNSNLYRLPIQSNPESLWRANQSNPEYIQSNPEYGQSNSGLHKPSENHQIEPSESGARKRATRAPAQFSITDKMRDWYRQKKIPGDIDTNTEHFLDHHRAKGSKFIDWVAAWRTWMNNEQKFARQNGGEFDLEAWAKQPEAH